MPHWREHGLDPDAIYRIFDDPCASDRAAESFCGVPLTRGRDRLSGERPRNLANASTFQI
jgi:hypothetical protein